VKRLGKALVILVAVVALVAGGAALYGRSRMQGSLALVSGRVTLPGLTHEVTVARDAWGVPKIAGTTRDDVARALGFVHAQERFFQMDLQRRQPAG
jgi:penicillin amidase